MAFSRQELSHGLPFPPPGDLPYPGIEPTSLMSPALAGRSFTTSTTWEALDVGLHVYLHTCVCDCLLLERNEIVRVWAL